MDLCLISWLIILVLIGKFEGSLQRNNAFDLTLYEDVLDPQECEKQLSYIRYNTTLQFLFIDVGARTPRGMLLGNFKDMGSYYGCLNINEHIQDMSIEGKYCMMRVPLQQDLEWQAIAKFPWPNIPLKEMAEQQNIVEKLSMDLQTFEIRKESIQAFLGQSVNEPERTVSRMEKSIQLDGVSVDLAVCIPKVCTVRQTLDNLTNNVTANLEVDEAFCRLPNDKPLVAADYVAIAIFTIIGLLTILSTTYDIRHSIFLKKDPKEANKVYMLFSICTNTSNFFTFKPNANAITCLDGIRSFAMLWVIIGHTFANQVNFNLWNPLEFGNFISAFSSLWVTSATITVDTFFMISGLLIVYTTAAKMSRTWLLKNLHLFYLNRFLRMFPVLATVLLLQVSFMNWITDGPFWGVVAVLTNNCRQNWWLTLLYVQNFVNSGNICLGHTWYLAIDMQLYVISPIVLFWVLGGNKRSAWTALLSAFVAVIISSTIYNFLKALPAAPLSFSYKPTFNDNYMFQYYFNTLTRGAPFFVGMIFGYTLHLCRRKKVHIPKMVNIILWLLATAGSSTVILSHYFVLQPDWNNQTVNNIINSFIRPAWAACVAWMVFACHHGYGGPINWVLSLHVFKILGRLSYAMYIVHYNIIFMHYSTELTPIYFSLESCLYRFLADVNLTVLAAFIITIFIDAPFSGFIEILLGANKSSKAMKKNDDQSI